ncbi:hypothetical protein EIP91_008132 [Steccherinum ochraceum]|uniref:F-box domain-containing protein n=1 Tax=Steccherinum ochraceum TaxID=92696 RepID=A0A4R0RH38_9APHY|nr:hypothetical protein EIP91_008132 [Steccherinum ochraceum]
MKRLRRPSLKASDPKPLSTTTTTTTTAIPALPGSTSEPPPLYARFATTHKHGSSAAAAKPIVSGPMALSARPGAHQSPSRGGAGGGGREQQDGRQVKRVASKPETQREAMVPPVKASPARTTTRSALAQANHNYNHSAPAATASPPRIRQSVSLDTGYHNVAHAHAPPPSSPPKRPALPMPSTSTTRQEEVAEEVPDVALPIPIPVVQHTPENTKEPVQKGVVPIRFPESSSTPPTAHDRRGVQPPFPVTHAQRPGVRRPTTSVPAPPKDAMRVLEATRTPGPSSQAAPPDRPAPPPSPRNGLPETPPPARARARASRSFEQHRISYDLSPENYWKTIQPQASSSSSVARPASPQKRPASPQKQRPASPQPQLLPQRHRPPSPQKRLASPQKQRSVLPTPSASSTSSAETPVAPVPSRPRPQASASNKHTASRISYRPPSPVKPSKPSTSSSSSSIPITTPSTSAISSPPSSPRSRRHHTPIPTKPQPQQQPSPSRPSLTASPSTVRKKYSPLAAFGLPATGTQEKAPELPVAQERASKVVLIPTPASDVVTVQDDDKAQTGGSMVSGYESLSEIPTIPTPQPDFALLPEIASISNSSQVGPTWPEGETTSEDKNKDEDSTLANAENVSPQPHPDSSAEPGKQLASEDSPPSDPSPATTRTLVKTVPAVQTQTRVRIISTSRAQALPKKDVAGSPSSQATQVPRARKPSSVARPVPKPLPVQVPRRDSPSTASPASSSPKSQPRKLGDPVDLVTLDSSLPSDSRYPLPSRSSSRSSPSPALNSSSRASPTSTADMPDGGRAEPSPKDFTSSARLGPRGSRGHHHHHHRTESSSQPAAPPHSSATMDPQGPAYQSVPVRGRPLIFAAMTVAPSESADIEPDPAEVESGVAADAYDVPHPHRTSAHYAYGYPSPTSSGQRSPQKPDTPPEEPPAVQEVVEVSRKPRKLSKTRKPAPLVSPLPVMRSPEVIPPVPPIPASNDASHRLHHHHHQHHNPHGQPTQVVDAREERERESPRKRPVPLEHNKSSRHGVKQLTDKQLEKLGKRSNRDINAAREEERERERDVSPAPLQQVAPTTMAPSPPPAPPPKQLPTPPSPPSPEDYARARSQRRGHALDKSRAPLPPPPPVEFEEQMLEEPETPSPFEDMQEPSGSEGPSELQYYPLARHVSDPVLLANLLCYLAYFEWCQLAAVSREIRTVVAQNRELEELVLERYLRTVGYDRWSWKQKEPLKLSLQDLSDYMRGVSIPSHQYARTAELYLQRNSPVNPLAITELSASCRAFTRVVLRLRAQAEAEADHNARIAATLPPPSPPLPPAEPNPPKSKWARNPPSRASSRAPSPSSSFTHGSQSHAASGSGSGHRGPVNTFRSPLFRPRRAPLLQVFVPSPEGDWLSDASVLECEAELKRAGVLHCLRAGDVIWDVAVGDEGNVGRLVWDGCYLIDLDYTYSRVGDLPRYLPTLAFPPSYFHRVIRTMGTGNPVVHVDLAPWADQIASNLQLLQDRMKTETPQGGHHTVVRWVHRSSFTLKPTPGSRSIRIPVPKTAGPGPSPSGAWLIDPGWYGSVVVETEGTNEGLADLQARCRGAFPVRAEGASTDMSPERMHREERRTVFRILRERSRPGEIWLRTVREKERILPSQ